MKNRQEKNIFDQKLWDFYETEGRNSFQLAIPRSQFIVKQILKMKNIKDILDIGFGDGQLLNLLSKEKRFNLAGIDISEKNIEKTRKEFHEKGVKALLKYGSITQIPFENEKFDLVIASEVLEHLNEKELYQGLLETKRVLKNKGFFLGTVPAYENLNDNTVFCPKCGNIFHRWGHKQSFDKEKIKDIFKKAQFDTTIELFTVFLQPFPRDKFSLEYIKWLIKFLTFHLSRRILGAQYWFLIICQK